LIDRLLSISDPWLQHAIRADILKESKESLAGLRHEALEDGRVKRYLEDVSDFHGTLVTNHKNPELPLHKLLFLLDVGLGRDTPEIESAVGQIMGHKEGSGVYQSLTNVPKHFGGKGEDVFGWCLCDAPLLLTALIRAGVDYQQHIKQGVDRLASMAGEQGFPCTVSETHGTFRGPGRKGDCCPYATLAMLNLMAETEEHRGGDAARNGVDAILSLWGERRERHPYMFYMGTDFCKLKAPAMWYDILSVADCLSKFEWARSDERFQEMAGIIRGKQGEDGMFTPESVYQKCKEWDFGQKKAVSPYLSFLCIRLLMRLDG